MAYSGQLNSNAIFAALFNMIISQQVFADNIQGDISTLVDSARVDGSLFGDTKIYYSTDALKSVPWGADADAANLLALHRPPAPKQQAIKLDVFRQIAVTIDNYLSKQAWQDEGSFGQFNSVILGWLGDTKKVYDATKYNAFIGTAKSAESAQNVTVSLAAYPTLGQGIAQTMADLFVKLEDVSRDYNDDALLRSFSMSSIKVVWNAAYVNAVKKIDEPVLFHKEGLIEKFGQYVLPARFFGVVNTTKSTADASTRALEEMDVTVSAVTTHVFPGDIVPFGASLYSGGVVLIPSYQEDAKIICKVMCVDSVPYMSAFEVGTSFYNPRSLTENHYLTFGHNSLVYLTSRPMITVKEVA